MTQMSASRTSRMGFPVRVRMPMKIDTCCVIRSVANVTPKMSPRNLLRSPVSIRSAIQLMPALPALPRRTCLPPVRKAREGPNRGKIRSHLVRGPLPRTCGAPWAGRVAARGESAEGNRAERSAPAEGSALPGAGDAELLHFGLEGGPFHRQTGRGPVRTTQHPARFAENTEDVLPFGVGQGPWRFGRSVGRRGLPHPTLSPRVGERVG